MMDFAAMGINLLISWATGRSLDNTLGGLESRIRNPRKALEKAVKKICTKYDIDEESLKERGINELRSLLKKEQWIEFSLEFLNELSKSDKEKKLFEILIENRINLENVKNRIEELNLGSLEAMMRFSTTAFSFYELPIEEELRDELGPFELTYIKRETIRIDNLKKKEKVVFAGKCGSGKSRLLFEILKRKKNVVFLRSFFKENDVMSLGMVVQPLTDFVIVWDNLHMVKEEEIRECLKRINAVCQEKGVNLHFYGASRREKVRYGLSIEEISLPDMRKKQLVDVCSKKYGKEIDRNAAETLLAVGDGTPEYILSFFKTFRKKVVTEEDLENCPLDVVKLWVDYIKDVNIKGTAVEKALRSVALSSRGFERVVLEDVEDLYSSVFYGDLSRFDDSMRSLQEMFFIEKEGEERYSFHDSRAEAVEREFPLEMKFIDRLIAVVLKLPEEVRRYALRNYADWSLFAERYEICVKFYDSIIDIGPELAQAYNNRGLAYSKLSQYDKAIKDYDKALEIDPELTQAYYNRGNSYSKLNQYERAIKDYDKALEIDPEYAYAYNNRGNSYYELNQYERAIKDYDKALEIDPEYAQAYYNRGNSYYELNQYERAIKDYDKALEIDPEYAYAYNNRGLAYHELNQHDKAIRDYDKALEIDPELTQAYNNRGLAYHELNQHDKAIKDYDKALEIDPEYAHAYYNRGNSYYELNQYDKAVKDYDRALNLRETFPDRGAGVYRSFGEAMKGLENFEEAAHGFKTAGIIFLSLNDSESSLICISKGFNLIEHVQNEYVEYCGLFLYIILKDNKIRDTLQKIKIKDRTLNDIFTLALRRDKGENIEKEIKDLSNTIGSLDLNILLSLLTMESSEK